MTDWLDIALVFDATTRRADVRLSADGDLMVDTTPVTPMLITVGSDRRARADDALPTGLSEINAPTSFVERRGWAGDALDISGRKVGVRLWLLDRAKSNETTRLMAAEWLKEGFAWVEEETGTAAEIEVEWRTTARSRASTPYRDQLAYRVHVAGSTVAASLTTGG